MSDKCKICRYNINDFVCCPIRGECDGKNHFKPYNLRIFKTIAVDFDGTLCKNRFPEVGEPNELVIDWVKRQAAAGANIILHTCRENGVKRNLLDEALRFCAEQGIKLSAVNENPDNFYNEKYGVQHSGRKLFADVYIDDKAINTKDLEAAMSGMLQEESEETSEDD